MLAFPFGGQSSSGLPFGGNWKCLDLSRVKDAELGIGAWRKGERHSTQQTCVEDVDLDINIHVRKLR